jgi:hypothetical protein
MENDPRFWLDQRMNSKPFNANFNPILENDPLFQVDQWIR